MKRTLNYSEGDVFAVPISEGKYVSGVVARMNQDGLVFGYFFGQVHQSADKCSENVPAYRDAVLQGLCGDLGLLTGEWPVVGKISNWSRDAWPMPHFYAECDDETRICLTALNEDTFDPIDSKEVAISTVDLQSIPEDGSMGHKYVEGALEDMILEAS